MKRFILTSIALAFLVTTVAQATGNARMGLTRWQNKAGWGSVDSLTWSNQAGNSKKDSLGTTITDTTTNEVDISGCNYVSFWVTTSQWHRAAASPSLGGCAKFTFQVSPDLGTWISLATTYSQTDVATDTQMIVLYDKDAVGDTIVGGAGASVSAVTVTGADMRKVRSSKFVRVIASPSNGAAGDSLLVKNAVVVREWPLDVK